MFNFEFSKKIEDKTFDPNREPESVEDYERMIAATPNSSYLWIKYATLHLELNDIAKARNVIQKALATISYREETERLNVWVALLNIENLYGTEQSLEENFNKATQNCDSFKVHCHVAEMLARSAKIAVSIVVADLEENLNYR